MGEATLYELRKWHRRAVTLQLKAEDLAFQIMDRLGTDHSFTDVPDGFVHSAEQLVDHFEMQIAMRKRQP